MRLFTFPVDVVLTSFLMFYYGIIGPTWFVPIFLAARLLRASAGFHQQLNSLYYRSFFWLLRLVLPWVKIRIDPAIREIQGSVVVCNHLSFLDSILLVSIFDKHKTIVKPNVLQVPFLGWAVKSAQYLHVSAPEQSMLGMVQQVEALPAFFASGANLFVFPEGHRSRDGRLQAFRRGAFGISIRSKTPIEALQIQGSDRLYPPGRWFFRTCVPITIRLDRIHSVSQKQVEQIGSAQALMKQVHAVYQRHQG